MNKLGLFLTGFLMGLVPVSVWACPLCVNASPYKDGLLVAVGFLIFVPFIAAYFMYGWIRRASNEG